MRKPLSIGIVIFLFGVTARCALAFDPSTALDGARRAGYSCPSDDPTACSEDRIRYLKAVKRVMCRPQWTSSLDALVKRISDLEQRISLVEQRIRQLRCFNPSFRNFFGCSRLRLSLALLNLRLRRALRELEGVRADFIRECRNSARDESAAQCPNNVAGAPPIETQQYCGALLAVLEDPTATPQAIVDAIKKAVNQRCQDVSDELALCVPEQKEPTATPTPSPTPTLAADVATPSPTPTPVAGGVTPSPPPA